MKLKNIAAACAEILGLQDVVELIKTEAGAEELKKNNSFNVLHRCANLVLGNIAGNYVECVTRQEFLVLTNRISFDRFEHDLVKILSVKKDGTEVGYELYVDHMRLTNGTVDIEYAYMPHFENAESVVAVKGITEDCLIYGVLAEYAFISGMFNEAKVWNEKFEHFLFSTSKKSIVMPAV